MKNGLSVGSVSVLSAIGLAGFASAQQFQATVLPTLGGSGAAAYGVNDAGHAVGAADLEVEGFHAGIWSNGQVH